MSDAPQQAGGHPSTAPAAGQDRLYAHWKWRVLLATMVCYLFYYTGRFNLAICMSDIGQEFGWSNTKLGGLVSILILTYGTGQLINGGLGDRFGRVLMPIGAVVSCLMNWAFSFAPSIGSGLATALNISNATGVIFATMGVAWGVNGYFQAMGMAPGGRLISNWWVRSERGRAMGFYTFAAAMSNVTVFLLASQAAGTWGWRAAFRYPVLLMAIVSVVFYFVTKDRPEHVGLASREAAGGGRHGGSLRQYLAALKHRSFMLACCSIGLHHVTRWGLLSFLPKYFKEVGGLATKGAGFLAAALPLGMAVGTLSGGFISDKLFKGKRSTLIFISLILCACCTVLLPGLSPRKAQAPGLVASTVAKADEAQAAPAGAPKEPLRPAGPAIVLMLLVSGFVLYVSVGVYFALCPDLLGVENAGTGIGIMDAVAYGFAAAGTATIGWLADAYGWDAGFWFMGICSIIGAVLIFFIREEKTL